MFKTILKEHGLSASRDPLTLFFKHSLFGNDPKGNETIGKTTFPSPSFRHPMSPLLPLRGSRLPALPRSAGRPRLADAPRNPPKGKETIGKTMFWWESFRKTMLKT